MVLAVVCLVLCSSVSGGSVTTTSAGTPICSLTDSAGTSFSLSMQGTVSQSSLSMLPSYLSNVQINFCNPLVSCGGVMTYACATNSSTGTAVQTNLCAGQPTGVFINPTSPQLGSTFTCRTPTGIVTKGIVRSTPPHNSS